ncbi:glycosyltransferase [Iodobacter fluviatilis]|uniref:Colanic acid biosynthesis glycosyltransferase WcaL n=1 Tax=Iodobacter fluviatilis TaxID=537 RepID=A0A377Q4Q5_9NEIS|nr:glycosyltransferase [Iodobacter fluviatilis]TCU81507.1 glycosyltransferase involved in cell wall biosynthesis [Iodobacter fluviatilis]STQ89923.1 colanic acid biosynthesis glycosyltransferase WcaL [Iodobacter fluviatilis]
MKANNSENPSLIVDFSHMGRKITGIERISEELFSPSVLKKFNVMHTKPATALGMIKAQWLDIPLLARKNPQAQILFPGFPPSILISMLFGKRVVPYIHDLFLLERPEELNIRARLYMRPSFIYAIKNLKMFFVNSQTTADNLAKVTCPDARIYKLRPRAENVFSLDFKERSLPAGNAPLKIMMLGTLEPRKNYLFAAQMTQQLSAQLGRPVELHISGREGWGNVLETLKPYPHIKYHGYLSIDELQDLLDTSHLFLCTSLDEGLGLPLLEVLYSGIPIIASDIPVFKEVTANAKSVLISNSNEYEASCSIAAAIHDGSIFETSITAAKNAIESWNTLAQHDRKRAFSMVLPK